MKVGVIMGGISSEREISLKSGNSIVEKIDKNKYEVIPVVIDDKEDIITKVKGLDFALLALHGKFGEDGTVQSVLQTLDIPYSGCGPISSGICMDKDFTKRVLKANDIRTARWINVSSIDEIDYDKIEEMGYPVFVKPTNGGSSVATFKVKEKSEIRAAVEEGLKWDCEVMIEEFIEGEDAVGAGLSGQPDGGRSDPGRRSEFRQEERPRCGASSEQPEIVGFGIRRPVSAAPFSRSATTLSGVADRSFIPCAGRFWPNRRGRRPA